MDDDDVSLRNYESIDETNDDLNNSQATSNTFLNELLNVKSNLRSISEKNEQVKAEKETNILRPKLPTTQIPSAPERDSRFYKPNEKILKPKRPPPPIPKDDNENDLLYGNGLDFRKSIVIEKNSPLPPFITPRPALPPHYNPVYKPLSTPNQPLLAPTREPPPPPPILSTGMLNLIEIKEAVGDKINNQEFEEVKLEKIFSNLSKSDYIHTPDWIDAFSISEIHVNFNLSFESIYKNEIVKLKELIMKEQTNIATNIIASNSNSNPIAAGGIDTSKNDENICKICMDAIIECVFVDCGHMICCQKCSFNINLCPYCRKKISKVVKVFK